MELAAEKEHPEEENVCCSNCCNDVGAGKRTVCARNAALLDNAGFFREEVRRAF